MLQLAIELAPVDTVELSPGHLAQLLAPTSDE